MIVTVLVPMACCGLDENVWGRLRCCSLTRRNMLPEMSVETSSLMVKPLPVSSLCLVLIIKNMYEFIMAPCPHCRKPKQSLPVEVALVMVVVLLLLFLQQQKTSIW